MGKIARTWSLMADCLQVLKEEKSLLLLPLISCLCCMLLMASFAIPFFITGAWHMHGHQAAPTHSLIYYGVLFVFYACNYFIIIFFNAAIISCAATRMTGGTPTIGDGLRTAASRLPVIAGWALVSATVGLLLRIIEERSPKLVGQIVAGLLGMGWTIVSFLVVPILVIENKGPIAALQESTTLLKRTWGEQIVGNFSFGSVFFLLMLPAFALVVAGFYFGGAVVGIICAVLAVLYMIVLSLIQSALQAIFQTALYLYARDGQVPAGFHEDALSGAWR
jgi:hypothetical protein